MTAENQDKLIELRASFESDIAFLGIIEGEGKYDFQFKYTGDMKIQCMFAPCWCTAASYDPETGIISGTFTAARQDYYKVNDLLFVDENDNPYQTGQHARTVYYFPILGGSPAVPQTLETQKKFRKLGGALESKEMTIYFDDGEPFYTVDEGFNRVENTNKLHLNLKIQGLVDLS